MVLGPCSARGVPPQHLRRERADLDTLPTCLMEFLQLDNAAAIGLLVRDLCMRLASDKKQVNHVGICCDATNPENP